MPAGHSVTIDGLLNDWFNDDRIDFGSPSGFRINATSDATYFYFSITAPSAIGTGTTVWLNTDRNTATGYQIFGATGGAEYNVEFASDGTLSLFTGGTTTNPIVSGLTAAWSADQTSVEFRVTKGAIGSPNAIDTLYDINNSVFLPATYPSTANGLPSFTVFNDTGIVPAADTRIAIVYSDTTANAFFNKTAYSQLFMSVQSQAMQAGIPFDILSESDLTSLTTLAKYDAIVFPSFRNVQSAQVTAIAQTLEQAVKQFDIGLITGGDFMTNDQNGNALGGDAYSRMKLLFDVTRVTGGTANVSVTATAQADSILENYANGAVIETYSNIGWSAYTSVSGSSVTVANQTINGSAVHPAVLATQTGSRNVHFTTEGLMADSNMLQDAIEYAAAGDGVTVGLQLTRQSGIVATRVDMDASMRVGEVNPSDGSPGVYDILMPILASWKANYNFTASYFVNIGNNVAGGETTDWPVSLPYYQTLIAMGGEIGSHSYTHPFDTNALSGAQIAFEFGNSTSVLETQLGYNIVGAAVPGAPETLTTSLAILPYVDSYLSGGYSGKGAGYPNAFGYLTPQQQGDVYLAPNTVFDFNLIEFRHLSIPDAEAAWAAEWNETAAYGDTPIVLWPIHDYAVAMWEPGGVSPYQTSMFTNWVARAYNEGSEFVTLANLASRITAFKAATVTSTIDGNVLTATVSGSNLGTMALDLDRLYGDVIQKVAGWYAYDEDSVFLPASGGTFAITGGQIQDDVTHITRLPMRASLLSLSGNGQNLSFSIAGEGKLEIDLKAPGTSTIQVTGATIASQVGEILTLDLGANGTHNVSVTYGAPATVTITSNGGGATAALNRAENGTAVTTVTATASGAVAYSLVAGGDAALFSINASTGALAFLAAPNFEAPTDAGTNNVYDVTVRATSGAASDTQAIAITVTNVNEAPVITSSGGGANGAASVAENTTAVLTVTSTDPENTARTYSLAGGADAARFAINASTGALSFLVAPNFEAPADAGANNVYDVIVRASDGALNDTQALAVTVTDVAAEPVVISSNGGGANAAINVAENGTAVTTVVATGAGALTYSLVAGGDSALFSINASTGVLTFLAAPNFEAPTDAGANNVYNFTVQASDGTTIDTQALAVTVTNVSGATQTAPFGGGTLNGTGEEETLNGQGGNDTLNGLGGNDTLNGNGGGDTINGGDGNDRITPGTGLDIMFGGADNDTFVFTSNTHSSTLAASRDIVRDFLQGADKVDLSGIDANTSTGGNGTFAFIGTAAFTALGQVRYVYETVSGVEYTVIQSNNTGSLSLDFSLALEGHHVLAATDFIL